MERAECWRAPRNGANEIGCCERSTVRTPDWKKPRPTRMRPFAGGLSLPTNQTPTAVMRFGPDPVTRGVIRVAKGSASSMVWSGVARRKPSRVQVASSARCFSLSVVIEMMPHSRMIRRVEGRRGAPPRPREVLAGASARWIASWSSSRKTWNKTCFVTFSPETWVSWMVSAS